MTRSESARRRRFYRLVVFVSLCLAALAFGNEAEIVPEPKLGCGTYAAQGTLKRNASGDFVLVFNDASPSPTELILLGGSAEKWKRLGTRIAAELYVPKRLRGNHQPYVFLKKISTARREADFIGLTKRERCNLIDKFSE